MISINDTNNEKFLLYNGLLFCALRMQKSTNEKCMDIENYVREGADVSVKDANDNNNTPLHIAVKKNELDVVKFLIKKGANPSVKNKLGSTPLDLAKLSQDKKRNEIIDILKKSMNPLCISNKTKLKDMIENKGTNESLIKAKEVKDRKSLDNVFRPGTAEGFSGQLYEIKLLALLLHRALHDIDIETFFLGSNVGSIDCFDDIVFKYTLKGCRTPFILFVQVKHRDNPEKGKLTVESVLKQGNDFTLSKYFISYLKIMKKYKEKSIDEMFQQKIEMCYFIIYTSATESFCKKNKIDIRSKMCLLGTGNTENVFKFDYSDSDLDVLLKQTSLSTAINLAKAFAKNIATQTIKGNFKNIMFEDLIKTYHVFLVQNVVDIVDVKQDDFFVGKFKKSFLESKNDDLMLIKETIFKEFDKRSMDFSKDTLEFKLPKYFGNIGIPIKEEFFAHLCNIFKNLMKLGKEKGNTIIITVVDDSVGPNKMIEENEMIVIGNLVGNTLIHDKESGLLKLNVETCTSEEYQDEKRSKQIFECLKLHVAPENYLKSLRFDISVKNFPQILLFEGNHLRNNLVNFLNKLYFFTNQSKEKEVEEILKKEINDFYSTEEINTNAFCEIRSDAIYFQYLDMVQKWWRLPKQYLTKSCSFYEDSKQRILNSPILNLFHYLLLTKIKSLEYKFNRIVIETFRLGLGEFTSKINKNISYNIITDDKVLSCIKIDQYFDSEADHRLNYKFLDFELFTKDTVTDVLLSEMFDPAINLIVFIMTDDKNKYNCQLDFLNKQFDIKTIIISEKKSISKLMNLQFDCVEYYDLDICLSDLNRETRHTILYKTSIVYQGFRDVPLNCVIDEDMNRLVKGNVLHTICANNTLKIGKEPIHFKEYYENMDLYINRRVCRCIKLTNKKVSDQFNVIYDNDVLNNIKNDLDIIIISDNKNKFDITREKYINNNIHWFIEKYGNKLWETSHGSISTITPWVTRNNCENENCSIKLQTLQDINERVIIIGAGPGMGKSTLMKNLLMQTKQNKRNCIILINMLDLSKEFYSWQEHTVHINQILLILFRGFSAYQISPLNSDSCESRIMTDITRTTSNIHEFSFFEYQVFLNLYNKGVITVVLDGFDEICPNYKDEALFLLRSLINSKIQKLWITCRTSSTLNALECLSNTFSFLLQGFSYNEQTYFLRKTWNEKIEKCSLAVNIQIERSKNIDIYANQFFDALSLKMNDDQRKFTSIPLHLRMIAVTFYERFINYYILHTPDAIGEMSYALNLTNLYEKFIDYKFYDIRFSEKKVNLDVKDPDMKAVLDQAKSIFINDHKNMAALLLLHRNNGKLRIGKKKRVTSSEKYKKSCILEIVTEADIKHNNAIIQRLQSQKERTGIVEFVHENEPKFVHFTYAEYFASEFLFDKIRLNLLCESTWKYFIDVALVLDNGGIRTFINGKLEKEKPIMEFTFKFISDTLLRQYNTQKSAFYVAVSELRENITAFILNNFTKHIDTSNIDNFIRLVTKKYTNCILCNACSMHNVKVVTQIIEIIKRIDVNKLEKLFFCEDYPKYNILIYTLILFKPFKESVCMLLEHTKAENLTKLFRAHIDIRPPFSHATKHKYTIFHKVFDMKENTYILEYLKKLNQRQCMTILYARDMTKKIPAHWAAINNNYEFYALMETLVNKNQFKKICTLPDENGFIPLQFFNFLFHTVNLEKFQALCAKVDIAIGFEVIQIGWYLYDIKNPYCRWYPR